MRFRMGGGVWFGGWWWGVVWGGGGGGGWVWGGVGGGWRLSVYELVGGGFGVDCLVLLDLRGLCWGRMWGVLLVWTVVVYVGGCVSFCWLCVWVGVWIFGGFLVVWVVGGVCWCVGVGGWEGWGLVGVIGCGWFGGWCGGGGGVVLGVGGCVFLIVLEAVLLVGCSVGVWVQFGGRVCSLSGLNFVLGLGGGCVGGGGWGV